MEVSQVLKIRNPNSTPVAFKVRFLCSGNILLQSTNETLSQVKTTAPKQYVLRPSRTAHVD